MQNLNTAAVRGTVATRPGASRKLLARKAAALPQSTTADALEDVFPGTGDNQTAATAGRALAGLDIEPAEPVTEDAAQVGAELATALPALPSANADIEANPIVDATPADSAPEPESAPSDAGMDVTDQPPASAPTWSEADEAALNAMIARRKSAGYQRRGRDVSAQLLRVGDISPNPGTVVATLVALVADRGTVDRAALLDVMAGATFPHAKAKPKDRGWCQGYVAGAVRDGFLAVIPPSGQVVAEAER